MTRSRTAILGTVGVPGIYGGFETLAENLVLWHERYAPDTDLSVWCSARAYPDRPSRFQSAKLEYVNLDANGVSSIPYDMVSLAGALLRGHNRILLLGVSGAAALPLVRLVSRARILTNIDGIEWKREKWSSLARFVLRASEWFAVRFSHEVIADNQAIADYVTETYGRPCKVIAYGGDNALAAEPGGNLPEGLPDSYTIALCRIEPENNVAMILEAFAATDRPLVFVGNWTKSAYGRALKDKYASKANLTLLDPIYDARPLRAIRDRATMYVHGHSAGGTNPSLVEMMQFGVPVLAHGCDFNRYSTEEKAAYFMSAPELTSALEAMTAEQAATNGAAMREIATRRYTWEVIGRAYFDLALGNDKTRSPAAEPAKSAG